MSKHISPVAVGVITSFAVVILLMGLGASIAGSYALMIHYVHTFGMHQMQDQLKSAVSTCKWLRAMDDASINAVNASKSPMSYGHKLAAAIHGLYIHSACPQILSGHYHPPQ